ncbi:MAG: T4SS-associated protein EirA [Pseudomonadota bacterium]|nr:T4SS-associated protein EirA [Pseudomonadota bacterium]
MLLQFFLALTFMTSGLGLADTDDNVASDSAESCYLPIPDAYMCPQPSELKKDPKTNTWTTDSGWISDSSSFSSSIVKFLGAQWKGVQLGQILCLYLGPNPNDFPVGVHKNLIVETPEQLLKGVSNTAYKSPWTIKTKSTQITMNCYSTTGVTCDCPFRIYQEKKESVAETINSIQQPGNYPAWGGY